MGQGEIWVCANGLEAGRHIKKVFAEGGLLNQVRLIDYTFDIRSHFLSGATLPLLLLLDISNDKAWGVMTSARESPAARYMPILALVDDSSEAMLDRAYEAGAKTYLRKPIVFAEFVLRARLLNLNFQIERAELKQTFSIDALEKNADD